MIVHKDPQGSQAWLDCRRGVITASRFRDCRDKLKNGQPSKKCLSYAQDLARERCGGIILPTFANAAMRTGTEQEPIARMAYENETEQFVAEAGFICTDDRWFGASVDGLVEADGIYECKTMVSSDTLFTALVDGDISDYVDQCNGALWLLGRKWIDLHLWCYDLPEVSQIVRINRDDEVINALETDLLAFRMLVEGFERRLRLKAA